MLDKGGQWGLIAEEHLKDAEDRSVNQLAAPYGRERMIYSVRGAGGTNIGGESHGGRHYKVDLRSGECTCMTPQLLHLPCSHLITACRARGLCFKSPTYLSPYYARSNTINIWESSFEPYLDPSQWPEYNGLEYVPDASAWLRQNFNHCPQGAPQGVVERYARVWLWHLFGGFLFPDGSEESDRQGDSEDEDPSFQVFRMSQMFDAPLGTQT